MTDHRPRHGVLVATALPLNDDLSVDHDRYAEHCAWPVANGCDGVVPNGSLGEHQVLAPDERARVVETAVAAIGGERVMPGAAAHGSAGARRWTEHAAPAARRACRCCPSRRRPSARPPTRPSRPTRRPWRRCDRSPGRSSTPPRPATRRVRRGGPPLPPGAAGARRQRPPRPGGAGPAPPLPAVRADGAGGAGPAGSVRRGAPGAPRRTAGPRRERRTGRDDPAPGTCPRTVGHPLTGHGRRSGPSTDVLRKRFAFFALGLRV
ncbi:4-hydroxy-tetrahydrodipicolinate synthase [Streptomyces sp. enrichment culture]